MKVSFLTFVLFSSVDAINHATETESRMHIIALLNNPSEIILQFLHFNLQKCKDFRAAI